MIRTTLDSHRRQITTSVSLPPVALRTNNSRQQYRNNRLAAQARNQMQYIASMWGEQATITWREGLNRDKTTNSNKVQAINHTFLEART